ncbi:MAG: DUF4363 family protein [Ruminococcus sp.]|nr:DUF4363 family protein [Ruminococcus sp.]
MTRIKISLGIISTLICISIFSGVWVNKKCDLLLGIIDEIQSSSQAGDIGKAEEYAAVLEEKWTDFTKTARILIINEKFDDAEEICSELPCITDSAEEITAAAEKLKHIIRNIKESESPSLMNIL